MYAVTDNCLAVPAFEALQHEVLAVDQLKQASRLLWLRQGGAVPFQVLQAHAPLCVALYGDRGFRAYLSGQTGLELSTLPGDMPHRCSLLVSASEGDHIADHYDVNYYRGRTFTVLLTVFNRAQNGQCCSANRTCAYRGGVEQCRDTAENSLLVMEGDKVLHSTRQLGRGEKRVVLSMIYTTDPSQTLWQRMRMKVKDWSFFS